mgnify:CR=1 FL=1
MWRFATALACILAVSQAFAPTVLVSAANTALRPPIDYGVAYDPRNRPPQHAAYHRPWPAPHPAPAPRTLQHQSLHDGVLLLRISVDGARIRNVQWEL